MLNLYLATLTSTHVDGLCSRLQQRLSFMRRLEAHRGDYKRVHLFYMAELERLNQVCHTGIQGWCGNLSIGLALLFRKNISRLNLYTSSLCSKESIGSTLWQAR